MQLLKIVALLLSLGGIPASAHAASQVLATVGTLQVTADELKSAVASSPFSNKFPSMDEDDQAALRGDMLRRLVTAKLLTLEAQRRGVDKTPAVQKNFADFRLGLLYRAYMEKLRRTIVIPEETQAAMQKQFKQDHDGMDAAKAAFISERYRNLTRVTIQNLLKQDNVQFHEERIAAGIQSDTVLAEGSGIRVRYGDVVDVKEYPTPPDGAWVKDQLHRRAEFLAVANAAAKEHIDVGAETKKYESERLPAAMMELKTKEWIPNEKALHDWYDKHPDAATIPERRHLGHLVVASQKEAAALRARIVKGESLFVLAGKYSVDPFSRKQNGDIGWIVQGRGLPELDQALSKLKDGETSEVIKTKDGMFHIVTILERVSGKKEDYARMRERIAQAIVSENLPAYVAELEGRYGVTLKALQESGEHASAKTGK